jgi:tetratricopeptide (TPR) repeat protein
MGGGTQDDVPTDALEHAHSAARAQALNGAGRLAWRQGDGAQARACFEAGLGLFRTIDDRQGIAAVLHNLGTLLIEQGDLNAGHTCCEECLALRHELHDRRGIAASHFSLGLLAVRQGDYARARA